jgi:hypothetical protein
MLWVPVDGIAQADRNPLTGLTTIGQQVSIQWDDRIKKVREESFTREAERAFELGLLRIGITLEGDFGPDGNYLSCHGQVFSHPEDNGNRASYSYEVTYREIVRIGGGSQFATTWDASVLGNVGVNNLPGTNLGEWCAEAFELAWRRANN